MSQSSFIAAILLASFVLFLAAKNRLGTYAAVLWGNTAAPAPQAASKTASNNSSSFASVATTAASFANLAAMA